MSHEHILNNINILETIWLQKLVDLTKSCLNSGLSKRAENKLNTIKHQHNIYSASEGKRLSNLSFLNFIYESI